jgi:hypothetical protein
VGLYVYGSLATGDFEPRVSDIDLIAVVRDASGEALLRRLDRMHEDLVRAEPEWRDRIEVDYVSARGLAQCRTHTTTIARISPGETSSSTGTPRVRTASRSSDLPSTN